MPEVLAGVLSMADIALHAITQGEIYLASTSSGSWSADAWVDLPVTITVDDVPAGAKALCLFQSSMRSDYYGRAFYLRCVIDGVPQLESQIVTEGEMEGQYQPSVCFAFVSGLSAGKHAFKIQGKSNYTITGSYWRNLRHIVAIMKR